MRNDNSMLVLDLASGETLGRVEVQTSPDGVTLLPAGDSAFGCRQMIGNN